MYNPDFLEKSDSLQDQFAAFVALINKVRKDRQLNPDADVALPFEETLAVIGLNSMQQLDSWLGEHPEICGFIHNGEVIITRCDL